MMTMRPTTLEDVDGNVIPGGIAECGRCKGNVFIITMIQTQSHPHYQCVECGISYCGTWDGTKCEGMTH